MTHNPNYEVINLVIVEVVNFQLHKSTVTKPQLIEVANILGCPQKKNANKTQLEKIIKDKLCQLILEQNSNLFDYSTNQIITSHNIFQKSSHALNIAISFNKRINDRLVRTVRTEDELVKNNSAQKLTSQSNDSQFIEYNSNFDIQTDHQNPTEAILDNRIQNMLNENCYNQLYCQRNLFIKKLHQIHPKLIQNSENYFFECADCILFKQDPLHQVECIINRPQVLQFSYTTFKFRIQEYIQKAMQLNCNLGLEIRCVQLDEIRNNHETTWPDMGEIHLNGKRIFEFKPIQINSALKRRKDEKHFIVDSLVNGENVIVISQGRPSLQERNTLRIHENQVLYAGVYLVQKMKPEQLCQKIRFHNVRNVMDCKERVMKQTCDSSGMVDKVIVSLNDALDLQPIRTPAKGRFCAHIQCFSLENFISLIFSMVPRSYKCPICKIKCIDLIIDEYFIQILKEVRAKTDWEKYKEVEFKQDGSYQFTLNEPDNGNACDSEDSQKKKPKLAKPLKSVNNSNQNNQQSNLIIIDSDSEKEILNKKKTECDFEEDEQNCDTLKLNRRFHHNATLQGPNATQQEQQKSTQIIEEQEFRPQQEQQEQTQIIEEQEYEQQGQYYQYLKKCKLDSQCMFNSI